jgi:hypothetical protein
MAKELCPGSLGAIEKPKFSMMRTLCPECRTYQQLSWDRTGAVFAEHQRFILKLNPAQRRILAAPLYKDMTDHQIAEALVARLREMGFKVEEEL